MENEPKNEYRKNLASKLKGIRNLDKDLAQEYLEKTTAKPEYIEAKKEKFNEHNKDKEKQTQIDVIKQEIIDMDNRNNNNISLEQNTNDLEKMGKTEKEIREKLSKLVESSETPEDKELFLGMLKNIDGIKKNIKKQRESFASKTNYEPTLDNINKHSKEWHSSDTFFQETLKKGENADISMNIGYLNKLTYKQQKSLLESLGFGSGKNLEDIADEYNKKYKSFLKRKVDLKKSRSHFMVVPTNIDGVFIHSINFGKTSNGQKGTSFTSLAFGTKFIEEEFSKEI